MSLLNTYVLKILLQHDILVNRNYYSLMYQLYPGLRDIELEIV